MGVIRGRVDGEQARGQLSPGLQGLYSMCGVPMAGKAVKRPKPAPAPSHLGPAGRQLWEEIHLELPDGWVLDHRERRILRLACEQQDQLTSLEKSLEKIGNVVEGSRGQQTMNPMVTECRQHRESITRLLSKLALPSVEDKPETLRQIQGREAQKKKKAQAASWKARQAAARGRSDG